MDYAKVIHSVRKTSRMMKNKEQQVKYRPSGSVKNDMTTRAWAILALLCTAQFIYVLNLQIVSIALPALQRGLGFSQENLQWVLSAYALTFGSFLLLAGRAADLFGHRRLFMIGMALFAVASLGCGLAPSQGVLIGTRVVQGLGMAIVTPAALALLTDTFAEGAQRNWAFGIWGAAGALGGIIGILLGGVLTMSLGWPWIFFLCVPLALLAFILAPQVLLEHHKQTSKTHLDIAGAVSATVGLFLLVYALTQAEHTGFASLQAGGLLIIALGFLATFGLIEGRISHPLVPLRIFHQRTLTGANLVTFVLTAVANTPIFFFVLYMQQVRGYSPLLTGLAFLPTNLTMIVGSVLGTQLTNWIGQKRTMLVGLCTLIVALLFLAHISVSSSYLTILLPGLIFLGFGLAVTQTATTVAGTHQVKAEERGLASGLLNTSVQIGTAVGLVILVTVANARTSILSHGVHRLAEALVDGFRWAFYAGAGLAGIGLLIALVVVKEQRFNVHESNVTPDPSRGKKG